MRVNFKTFLKAKRSITLCYVNVGLRAFKFIAQKPVWKGSEGNRELSGQGFIYLQNRKGVVSPNSTQKQLPEEFLNNCYELFNDSQITDNFAKHILAWFFFIGHNLELPIGYNWAQTLQSVYSGGCGLPTKITSLSFANIGHRSVAIPCSALPRVPI